MTRDRIAGIGFHHPVRNARPLTKRKLALANLLMTAGLVVCIVVAATAVSFGMARADTLNVVAQGKEGPFATALLIGILPLFISIPARWLARGKFNIAVKVVASWMIAIASLSLFVTLIPTPGYKPDHME